MTMTTFNCQTKTAFCIYTFLYVCFYFPLALPNPSRVLTCEQPGDTMKVCLDFC